MPHRHPADIRSAIVLNGNIDPKIRDIYHEMGNLRSDFNKKS